jgi:hypothetical protein
MPVFGKSLFETVLDVVGQQVDAVEEETAHAPVRGFNSGFVHRDWRAGETEESDPSLLFDGFPPDPIVLEPTIPAWVDRLSEAEIAEDLKLGTCRAAHDFRERRRLFAFENHPDRVPVDYRNQATRRMMIANQMIDAALEKFT